MWHVFIRLMVYNIELLCAQISSDTKKSRVLASKNLRQALATDISAVHAVRTFVMREPDHSRHDGHYVGPVCICRNCFLTVSHLSQTLAADYVL